MKHASMWGASYCTRSSANRRNFGTIARSSAARALHTSASNKPSRPEPAVYHSNEFGSPKDLLCWMTCLGAWRTSGAADGTTLGQALPSLAQTSVTACSTNAVHEAVASQEPSARSTASPGIGKGRMRYYPTPKYATKRQSQASISLLLFYSRSNTLCQPKRGEGTHSRNAELSVRPHSGSCTG